MEEGIDIFLRDEHPLNAKSPIDSTEEGIVISLIDVQLAKAFDSILITEFGIDIWIADEQPLIILLLII